MIRSTIFLESFHCSMVFRHIIKDIKDRIIWLGGNGYITDDISDMFGVSCEAFNAGKAISISTAVSFLPEIFYRAARTLATRSVYHAWWISRTLLRWNLGLGCCFTRYRALKICTSLGHWLHNKDKQMSGQVREMRQKCNRECRICAVVARNKYM